MQIDDYAHKAAAVVEAFLPALQAPALAAQLYGKTNRWGARKRKTHFTFGAVFLREAQIICQDRLGTTIREFKHTGC